MYQNSKMRKNKMTREFYGFVGKTEKTALASETSSVNAPFWFFTPQPHSLIIALIVIPLIIRIESDI